MMALHHEHGQFTGVNPTPGLRPGPAPIRVLIVDNHRMFAECLGHLLGAHDEIRVVGTATDGRGALALVTQHDPDVMVIDYQMPNQNGVDIATAARRSRPGMSVVMLSEVGDNNAAMNAIDAGCSGFLTKDASAAEVAEAVLATAAGDAHISPALLLRLLKMRSEPLESGSALTRRELDTLTQLVNGGTSKEIAARMGVSTSTIRNTVQSIITKLGAHSKLEAVTIAVRRGLVSYPAGGSSLPSRTTKRTKGVAISLV